MFSQCTNLIACIDSWIEEVGIELKQKCTQNANDERRNGQEAQVQSCCPIPGITHTDADTRFLADIPCSMTYTNCPKITRRGFPSSPANRR